MRIKTILALLLSVGSISIVHSQTTSYLDSVKMEIDSFIKNVKPLTIANGKYNVYVVTVKQKSDSSFTLSINFICNEKRIYETKADLFSDLDGEFVLFDISKDYKCIYKHFFNLKILDSSTLMKVKEKLVPTINGGVTGRYKGLVFSYKNGKIVKEFYNDAEEMPEELQIFKWPEGAVIERLLAPK